MTRHELFLEPIDPQAIRALPDMKLGAQAPGVESIQNYLRRFGYLTAQESITVGRLDQATLRALARLQQRYQVGEPGLLDAATRDFLARPRCGLPDTLVDTALGARTIWKTRLRFTYAFGRASSQPGAAHARDAVKNAFSAWTSFGRSLRFFEVGPDEQPDFLIEWLASGSANALLGGPIFGNADYPPNGLYLVEGRPLPVCFDDASHAWVDGPRPDGLDLETAAVHAIGHLLGLLHSNVAGSAMYPVLDAGTVCRRPASTDVESFEATYPTVVVREVVAARNVDGRLEVFGIGRDDRALYNIWQTVPARSPWSPWFQVGRAHALNKVALAQNEDGRLEVFGIGTDGVAYNLAQSEPGRGPWQGWRPLGGDFKDIVAAKSADGRLEAFAIARDDTVWHAAQTEVGSRSLDPWRSLGGGVRQVAVVCDDRGRLQVFAVGMDQAIYHVVQEDLQNRSWGLWRRLPPSTAKSIRVARNLDGRLEVFGIGLDNALWHMAQTGESAEPWTEWSSLGGVIREIEVISGVDGRLAIVGLGRDRAVYHISQDEPGSSNWSKWGQLRGEMKTIAVAQNEDGRLELFGVGRDDGFYTTWQKRRAGSWSPWSRLSQPPMLTTER